MSIGLLGWLSNFFRPRPKPAPTPPKPTPPKPTPPRPKPPAPVPPGEEPYTSALVRLINIERAARRLPLLAEDPRLNALAYQWAAVLAKTGRFDHGDWAGRLRSVYPNTAGAENIAWGQVTEDDVLGDWMRSNAGHRENVLGDWTAVGVGREAGRDGRLSWVATFAKIVR